MEEQVAETIDPEHHKEFRRFIETGEASENFLAYLDKSEECQHAVERIFQEQAAHFQELARSLALFETPGDLSLSPSPTAVTLLRKWNWRGAYPYALAASLVLALLASFLAWNVVSVARHEEHRATLLEEQYKGALWERHASQQRVADLERQLEEVQGKITETESLSAQNRQYQSEVSRLRRLKSELERALATERSRGEEARKEIAELQKGGGVHSVVESLKPRWEYFHTTDFEQAKTGEAIQVGGYEPPRVTTSILQSPPWYTFGTDVKVNLLINEIGIVEGINFVQKVPDNLRDAVESVVYRASFEPGIRNGEPEKMWTTVIVGFPKTGTNNNMPARVSLSALNSPPG